MSLPNQVDSNRTLAGLQIEGGNPEQDQILVFNLQTAQWEYRTLDGGNGGMNELEFIQKKVEEGNYFDVSAQLEGVGDALVYRPPVGKTAFLVEASCCINVNPSFLVVRNEKYRINSYYVAGLFTGDRQHDVIQAGRNAIYRTHETSDITTGSPVALGGISKERFDVKGVHMIANGLDAIEIRTLDNEGTTLYAKMTGYLVDTVVPPAEE